MTVTPLPEPIVGTCALCGQEMILTADDCWHPHTVERACPTEPRSTSHPDGRDDEGWHRFFAEGNRTGRPGREHFLVLPRLPALEFGPTRFRITVLDPETHTAYAARVGNILDDRLPRYVQRACDEATAAGHTYLGVLVDGHGLVGLDEALALGALYDKR